MKIIKPTKITIGDIVSISLIVLTFCLAFQNHRLINSNDKYIRISRNSIETYMDSIGIQLINNIYQVDSINKVIKEKQKVEASIVYEEIQIQKKELDLIKKEDEDCENRGWGIGGLYRMEINMNIHTKEQTILMLEQKYLSLKYNILYGC